MNSGQYTWDVDQETLESMKVAKTGHEFTTPTRRSTTELVFYIYFSN